MEGKSESGMAMTTAENKGKSIVSHQESFSQESSQSESTRQVGNATISEKSASFQSEEAKQVIETTGIGSISKTSQSSFTSTKEEVKAFEAGLNQVNEEIMKEPRVNEIIKSFEENQVANATNILKTEVETASKETNGSSSKALELINKFIDMPEPVSGTAEKDSATGVVTEPEKEVALEPVKEVALEPVKEVALEPVKEVALELVKEVALEPVKEVSAEPAKEVVEPAEEVVEPAEEVAMKPEKEIIAEPRNEASSHVDSIDTEMKELSKEIEHLKREEESCEKSFVNRQTSTSSLEDAFVKRLEERRYQSVQEMLADSLPPLFKVQKPESLPPGNLVHLLHSVQIAQELNGNENNADGEAKALEDDTSGRDNRPIDLEKLFTPATDSGEVTPSRNRKMYASSSFYSPFHPTVEDQVELARRISSSLCDISNKQSKGQSMYVNRMKRSVKWVHGGDEKESLEKTYSTTNEESSVINYNIPSYGTEPPKNPLKLVMNPHGKVQDLNSLTQQGMIIQPPLSPELCFDLVKDLNTTKGKGAELFAKRRKKSEKWVVDENTVRQASTLTSSSSMQRQTSQMSAEKAMSLSNQQREQQMHKMQEIKGRLNQPKVKLVKSPWDAALETGSVDAAFQEMNPAFPEPPISWTAKISETSTKTLDPSRRDVLKYGGSRSDLYLPNIPKGWTSPQFGSSLYGHSKTEISGSSSASNTVLSQLNTNMIGPTQTQLPPIDSTPRSVLKKPAVLKPEPIFDSEISTPTGQKRELCVPPFLREREQKVTFLEEFRDVSSKKIKTETVRERNMTAMEKELQSVERQIKSMDEEVEVKKLEQSANKTFKEVIKSGIKQSSSEGTMQKSKPASLVIGAVPLFKGLEDNTNLLHKELQSKLPARKQKEKNVGPGGIAQLQPFSGGLQTQHTHTQFPQKIPYENYLDRENLGRVMHSGPDQQWIKEKSHPLPQVPAQPTVDPMTALPSQSQHYSKLWDFSSWNNYNTAPRGWKQNLNYYRPVTFTPSYKLPENAFYTDY